MLGKEDLIVLSHYLHQGVPKAVVARKLGISRMTVHRHSKNNDAEPMNCPRARKPSLLDRYKDYIRGRLELYPELTAARLLDEITANGYPGKYTLVKDYVRLIRPKLPLEIEQRFEVPPGEQAQVDFATFKTSFGTVYALLVVLSWSRHLWVRFYCHQDQLTVLGGLHQAFRSFAGVPRTVLFDRMKTAVARSGEDGRAVFNDEMLRFAAHCGFRPVACRPHRAKTKGRVERAVSYLRHSFFYGRSFRDLEDLNVQVQAWLSGTANARVHGTTGEVPAQRLEQEKPHLLPLPDGAYAPMIALGRRMSRDGYVSYNGNDYSVPEGLVRRHIDVMATLDELRLYQDGKFVTRHPVLEGKGQRLLDPAHGRGRPVAQEAKSPSDIIQLIDVQRRPLEVYEEVLR